MAGQGKLARVQKGHESQKNRTRKALIAAAEDLLRTDREFTVTDAAEAAGISRATAYRYFPTQELLLAEVALFATGGPLFRGADESLPVPEAVGRMVRRVGAWAYANEQPLRTLLRLSLDTSTGVRRPGHRREWIADALAPAREQLDAESYDKLSRALTLMLGIDPLVVMKDIAGASREQALDALEWSARTLVGAAIGDRASMPLAGRGAETRGGRSPKVRRATSRSVAEKKSATSR
jgi:AcrR family transcriptional regulator